MPVELRAVLTSPGGLKIDATVIGDDHANSLDELMRLEARLQGTAPTVQEAAKPVTAKAARKDPDKAAQRDLDTALALLASIYRDPKTRQAARDLLTKYGVERFGLIPPDKGPELLADAEAIMQKAA